MRGEVDVVAKGVSRIEMSQTGPSSPNEDPIPIHLDPKNFF